MAIEVEQKFLLTPDQEERLLSGATATEQVDYCDIYFDNENFSLTTTDRWLRRRNNKFNLKIPQNWPRTSTVNTYIELETDEEIRQALEIVPSGDLEKDLKALGFSPFATIDTIRASYAKEGFNIDVDTAYLLSQRDQNSLYQIAEIELIVENKEAIPLAREEILQFATRHGLVAKFVRGKLVEHIYRYRPNHFQALIKAKVVVEEQTR